MQTFCTTQELEMFKQLQSQVLLNTKEQCMKKLYTIAVNVTIKGPQNAILWNTKEQYTKESNTHAGNATIK